MSNKTILQGHNKALESLKDIMSIPIGDSLLELLGCTKMVVDEFTLASDTSAYKSQLNHSLGEIPKKVFIIPKESVDDTSESRQYIKLGYIDYIIDSSNTNLVYFDAHSMYGAIQVSSSYGLLTGSYKPTTSTVILGASSYYKAGITYQLISLG